MSEHHDEESENQSTPQVMVDKKIKLPRRYKVLLHNDDYTTMEFVVHVLQKFFHKTLDQSQEIMLKVHNDGVATCGIYTYEIAETKVNKVTRYARDNQYPLKVTMEEE